MIGPKPCRDDMGNPIHGVFAAHRNQVINLSGEHSMVNEADFSHGILRIVTNNTCNVKFGDSIIEAFMDDDMLLIENIPEYFYAEDYTRIAGILPSGESGKLFITEMS